MIPVETHASAAGHTPPLAGPAAVAAEARRLEAQGVDVVRLEIGEPDVATPEHVVEAGVRAMRDGDTRYGPPEGTIALRAAVADAARSRGLNVGAERVVVSGGARPMLLYALLAVVRPGDEVLVPDPGYPGYASAVARAGGRSVRYSLLRDGSTYALDVEELRRRVTPRTRALVVNSPSNPTGAVTGAKELEAIAELASAHDLWVVSDEVYGSLVLDSPERAASVAALDGMEARTIVVDSFSKTYAMTGWRLGYGVLPRALVDAVTSLVVDSTTCVPGFVQRAGVAALTGPQDAVTRMRETYRERRDAVVRALADVPGVSTATPVGAFYAFADMSALRTEDGTTPTSAVLAARLLREEGVACVPGSAYGERGEGCLRLSFASPRARLDEGLRRIARFAASVANASE